MSVAAAPATRLDLLKPFDLDQWSRDMLAYPSPAPLPASGYEVTWADYYCGAGGSSSGIELVIGARVVLAANHWDLAVLTHQHNMPHADHDIADITGLDPRKHPRTDFAWFSPECTTWSVANGEKCDYDGEDGAAVVDGYADDGDDHERPLSEEAKIRSRVQMRDVVRFARVHQYRGVIVENVPDILKWKNLDRWLAEMVAEGYRYKILTLNSAFAHGLGSPAPQLRDRVFVVFWKAEYRTPNWDKWLRPYAWCPNCDGVVRGIFTAKPGPRRPMRYGKGAQYFYRCPKKCGADAVQPFILPAQSAIDLTLPTQRIRDRKRPLAPNTRRRVAAGLHRWHGRGVDSNVPMLVPTGGTWNDDTYPGGSPFRTRTTRENEAVVTVPAMTVSTNGRTGSGRARLAGSETLATQTTRHEDAVVDVPIYVPLRNNGVAAPANRVPTKTIAAGGEHHAVVMRNTTPRGKESRCTPLDQPVRTFVAGGGGAGQSVLGWDGAALFSYDTGHMRPLSEPMPTQTTVEGDALVVPGVDVDDCYLRMLAVDEIKDGMAFIPGFHLLGDAKKNKVRMLGNAVTPPCSRDLAACLMEAVLGVEFELTTFGLAMASA